MALPEDLPQAALKKFLPEGCTVWRNNVVKGFSGHCPPYKRVTKQAALFEGERGAALEILRVLWQQHAIINMLDLAADCWVAGLFLATEVPLAETRSHALPATSSGPPRVAGSSSASGSGAPGKAASPVAKATSARKKEPGKRKGRGA